MYRNGAISKQTPPVNRGIEQAPPRKRSRQENQLGPPPVASTSGAFQKPKQLPKIVEVNLVEDDDDEFFSTQPPEFFEKTDFMVSQVNLNMKLVIDGKAQNDFFSF